MGVYVSAYKEIKSDTFQETIVSQMGGRKFLQGTITFDSNSPSYPSRSDLKIMRADTIAAVLTAQEVFTNLAFPVSKKDIALFVASGSFIERVDKHLGHLLTAFETIMNAESEADKLKKIYRASPPLLALQTLTNSTMSFVAQYTGIKGNNATFGNTSQAGFDTIKAGFDEVNFENNEALVVASNIGSQLSYASNSSILRDTGSWKESSAASAALLSQNPTNAICQIVEMNSRAIHKFEDKSISRTWHELVPNQDADCLVFSGAFSESVHNEDLEYCSKHFRKSVSPFQEVGNVGATNIHASLGRGISLIEQGANTVDIVDRDVYNRESHIRISRI